MQAMVTVCRDVLLVSVNLVLQVTKTAGELAGASEPPNSKGLRPVPSVHYYCLEGVQGVHSTTNLVLERSPRIR